MGEEYSVKVLGLVGSPRKGGNTDLLVSAVLYGAGAGGHEIEKINLYDIDILPCMDCKGCKKGNFQCALKDGMKKLYPKLEEADVLVFGTPLYWYGSTAKMKLMVDRLRPYVASKKLKGKKTMLLVPSEEGADACSCLVCMFELSFKYLEMELSGKLLVQASERAEVKNQPKVLDEAFALGKTLT
ncbi:MAG: flavodoxin family protein [Candidatus Bathyarchaeota archaeon]|nr:flavodoxin family protein [Candidatus Bathyarchaeota archaeon]